MVTWFGFTAPMGTPADVVKRLADEMRRQVQDERFQEKA